MDKYNEMYELRKSGKSYQEIGLKFNMSHQGAQYILKKYFPEIHYVKKEIIKQCIHCKKTFKTHPCYNKKFCSIKCFHEVRSANSSWGDVEWRRKFYREKQLIYYKSKRGKENILKSLAKCKDAVKDKARAELHKAVLKGEVKKRKRCQICNKKVDRINGHHSDYSKPLDVIWCCGPCHYKLDRV